MLLFELKPNFRKHHYKIWGCRQNHLLTTNIFTKLVDTNKKNTFWILCLRHFKIYITIEECLPKWFWHKGRDGYWACSRSDRKVSLSPSSVDNVQQQMPFWHSYHIWLKKSTPLRKDCYHTLFIFSYLKSVLQSLVNTCLKRNFFFEQTITHSLVCPHGDLSVRKTISISKG